MIFLNFAFLLSGIVALCRFVVCIFQRQRFWNFATWWFLIFGFLHWTRIRRITMTFHILIYQLKSKNDRINNYPKLHRVFFTPITNQIRTTLLNIKSLPFSVLRINEKMTASLWIFWSTIFGITQKSKGSISALFFFFLSWKLSLTQGQGHLRAVWVNWTDQLNQPCRLSSAEITTKVCLSNRDRR